MRQPRTEVALTSPWQPRGPQLLLGDNDWSHGDRRGQPCTGVTPTFPRQLGVPQPHFGDNDRVALPEPLE